VTAVGSAGLPATGEQGFAPKAPGAVGRPSLLPVSAARGYAVAVRALDRLQRLFPDPLPAEHGSPWTGGDGGAVEPGERIAQAAVAAVFREQSELELLFIRRAEHPLDPWSGHMAFPGGRVDPGDRDPLSAAVRETREELALDLVASGRLLGRLAEVPAIARGRRVPLVIQPYVFALATAGEPELVPSEEVAEVLWVPFSYLQAPANRQTLRYRRDGIDVELPCYRYQGREIWGLTLRMIDDLLGRWASGSG
jgi:8-oxo-dGTP pyrophosphatase MutT (NUDIX family)